MNHQPYLYWTIRVVFYGFRKSEAVIADPTRGIYRIELLISQESWDQFRFVLRRVSPQRRLVDLDGVGLPLLFLSIKSPLF